MTEKRSWFQRPLAAVCLLCGLVVLSIFIILSSENRLEDGDEVSYRIIQRHYGIDAREMERTAAIPLEDALSGIPGIKKIVTQSENGQVRVFVNFRRARGDGYYDAVREAAQRVYETLPSSAQRPELSSAGDFRVPFWTAAVYGIANGHAVGNTEAVPDAELLEKVIKPALNSIAGVGELEIAGPGIREIVIIPDEEKCAALGLSPLKLSSFLAADDALFSGGSLNYHGLELPLRLDGRFRDLEALGEALIPFLSPDSLSGGAVKLKDIADIHENEREAEILTRLNGKRTALISITAASGADTGVLSGKIKKTIESFSSLPLEFHILEDRGAEEAAAFRSVMKAALGASLLAALAALLLGYGNSTGFRNGLVCAGAIPFILVISAALLSAMGFGINRKFLAGLAVGIGGAVDAVILGAEGFGRARDPSEGKKILLGIWPPLVSGAATTAAALIPVLGLSGSGNIKVIAAALGTVTLVSVVLALSLLPPVFLWGRGKRCSLQPAALSPIFHGCNKNLFEKIGRRFSGFISSLINFCEKRPLVFPVFSFVISAGALLVLSLSGAETAGEWSENSVYVQIEFEGGFLKEEADPLLAAWALDLQKNTAVKTVQTGARTGSGYAFVTFDPGQTDIGGIRNYIRSKTIPEAFIFIPEASPGDRLWNITVSGDDAEKCREIVREAASLCSVSQETVLNFKQGGPRLTLFPRRELLALREIPFSLPADTLRRGVHGPVVYKRTGGGRETDVRIKFSSGGDAGLKLTGSDVLRIPIVMDGNMGSGLSIGSLMEQIKSEDVSVIRRENRRRAASFSIRTGPGDPRVFRDKTMALLVNMDLPPGYKIEFDPEAIQRAEALSGSILNFIWAVLFCYMIIAAAEESFLLPLIILSAVPPSLAIPVFFLTLAGTPVNTAASCALIAVSGMTVNASVISAGELWRSDPAHKRPLSGILKNKIPALLAMTGTTIAGALPFLFLREGNNALLRTLALVTVLGVGSSFVFALTLVPSLIGLYRRSRGGMKNQNMIPAGRN